MTLAHGRPSASTNTSGTREWMNMWSASQSLGHVEVLPEQPQKQQQQQRSFPSSLLETVGCLPATALGFDGSCQASTGPGQRGGLATPRSPLPVRLVTATITMALTGTVKGHHLPRGQSPNGCKSSQTPKEGPQLLCLGMFLKNERMISLYPLPAAQHRQNSYFKSQPWNLGCPLPEDGQLKRWNIAESLSELGETLNITQAEEKNLLAHKTKLPEDGFRK